MSKIISFNYYKLQKQRSIALRTAQSQLGISPRVCVSHAISGPIESQVHTMPALSLRSLFRPLRLFSRCTRNVVGTHVRRIPAKRLACRCADLANVTGAEGAIKRASCARDAEPLSTLCKR